MKKQIPHDLCVRDYLGREKQVADESQERKSRHHKKIPLTYQGKSWQSITCIAS